MSIVLRFQVADDSLAQAICSQFPAAQRSQDSFTMRIREDAEDDTCRQIRRIVPSVTIYTSRDEKTWIPLP